MIIVTSLSGVLMCSCSKPIPSSGITVGQIESTLKVIDENLKLPVSMSDDGGNFSYSTGKDEFTPYRINGTVDKKEEVNYIQITFDNIDTSLVLDRSKYENVIMKISTSPGDLTMSEIKAGFCALPVIQLTQLFDPDSKSKSASVMVSGLIDLFSSGRQMKAKDWIFSCNVNSSSNSVVVSAKFIGSDN